MISSITASDMKKEGKNHDHSLRTDRKPKSLSQILCQTEKKLRMWIDAQSGSKNFNFHDIAEFIKSNPHWPKQKMLKIYAEYLLDKSVPTSEILLWFKEHFPLTSRGAHFYIDALLSKGYKEKARKIIKNTWYKMEFDSKSEEKFQLSYGKLLSLSDHQCRIENLFWKDKIVEAERLISQIYLKKQNTNNLVLSLLKEKNISEDKILPFVFKDEVLLYAYTKWNRKKKRYDICKKLLKKIPLKTKYAEEWWYECNYIAREFISQKKYNEAYDLIRHHQLTLGESYANAEWLSGWICLRFLNKPELALKHFLLLSKNIKSPISKARAYYWIGRVYEAKHNMKEARNWYHKGAIYKATFYGQLSASKIGVNPHPSLSNLSHILPKEKEQFEKIDLVQAIRLLVSKNNSYFRTFFCQLAFHAKPQFAKKLAVALAAEVSPSDIVWTAKKAVGKNHLFLDIAYPLKKIPSKVPSKLEKALILAVIYQESYFDPKEISPAGAMGLMQLTSGVAKSQAKVLNIQYLDQKLFDSSYNIIIGSHHLAKVLEKYDNSYVIALASYNAGEKPVRQWLNQFGDPRKSEIDVIDWIELIPYYETRNYIQRVLEVLNVYRVFFKDIQKNLINDLQK